MGNCCIMKESSTQWGGDDWGSPSPLPCNAAKTVKFSSGTTGHDEKLYTKPMKKEKSFVGQKKGTGTEVKIKISKKQLEELLSKVDVEEGQSVKEVLTHLLNLSDGYEAHPRPWRPALQSIPEAEMY